MPIEVKTTRSELLELKKKIKLSESGHKLLKMKRDGLIMEFFNVLHKAKGIRTRIAEECREAEEKIAIAMAVEGMIGVKSASFALRETPYVEVKQKNVMGVAVPVVEGKRVKKKVDERGYGVIGTSVRIDESAMSYEKLVESIISAAEVETTLRKLLDEIERTKRRVNALEFRVIPELKDVAGFITFRLEEMERDNIFRLKRIKG